MNEQENFVARWSRLKRENAQERREPPDAPATDPKQGPGADAAAVSSLDAEAAAPFDVSQLPSIDSLTPSSDIRAFLQSGVPAELTKAALRKVWTTDPAIRDFIGIAENQWDFTDPNAMPGFGPLQEGDDVAKLVAQAMGELRNTAQADMGAIVGTPEQPQTVRQEHQPSGMPAKTESSTSAVRNCEVEEPQTGKTVAVQHGEPVAKAEPIANRRTHGRALPR